MVIMKKIQEILNIDNFNLNFILLPNKKVIKTNERLKKLKNQLILEIFCHLRTQANYLHKFLLISFNHDH